MTRAMYSPEQLAVWAREWFAEAPPEPTVSEVGEAFERAFDGIQTLREHFEEHLALLLHDATDDEVAAARRHLAHQHAVVDWIAGYVTGIFVGRDTTASAMLRPALHLVLGTEDLAGAITWHDIHRSDALEREAS